MMNLNEYENRIINADCLDVLRKLPDKCVDLILTDPPYGMTNCKWDISMPFEVMWKHFNHVRKDSCPVVIFGKEPFSSRLRLSNVAEYKYDWKYHKALPTGHLNVRKQPLKSYEDVCVFYKKQPIYNPQITHNNKRRVARTIYLKENVGDFVYGKEKRNTFYDSTDRYPTDILDFINREKGQFHPTQKPLALMEYFILTYTNPGDLIVDPFSGSGTTAVAAHKLGRRFICIEKDPDYWAASIKRLEEARKQISFFGLPQNKKLTTKGIA